MSARFALTVGMLLGLAVAPAGAAPADAVRAADMDRMIAEIVALYEDAGLSWDHRIAWETGPFTTTFWYYSSLEDRIVVGAVPADAEVGAYWQTWSEVLTDGNFDPAGFFASDSEAQQLAAYNQFVLATHEAAHAMTYRYDVAHLERHDYAVNCREYYADRLTVAILNDQANRDPDMARWRARYRDLVTAMGDTIPEQYRYRIADHATLDADCAVIDVAQPTPETMQPYASAYFERYRVLLEADLPPLAQLLATHLEARWLEATGNVPHAPERDSFEVVTIGAAARTDLGRVYSDRPDEAAIGSRAAAFDPAGTLYFATLAYDPETRIIALAFGTDPEASPPTGAPAEWTYPSLQVELAALAVVSAERFVVALDHWDREGPGGEERHFITWVLATRAGGAWTLESLAELDGLKQGTVLRAPRGGIFLLATSDETSAAASPNWRGLEVALDTGEVVAELPLGSAFHFPIAVDDAGRLYEELGYRLWRSSPDGRDEVLVGSGLGGPRDGRGARAELSDLDVMQWMADGSALFLERGFGVDHWVVRALRPLQ